MKKKVSTCYPHSYPHIYTHFIEKIELMWYNFLTKRQDEHDYEGGEGMWYSAADVAKYIITLCYKAGKPVSNLKLQKMLYFLWVDFYKKTGRMLFRDNICAWQLGPVVPGVYYDYCSYAGSPICEVYGSEIEDEDAEEMDTIIFKYMDTPANELVNRTHEPGTAWDMVYKNGAGKRKIIPFDLIIKKEAG